MTSTQKLSFYSPKTMQIVEKYMKDANLTTLQRAAILEELRKGKSVPISLLRYELPSTRPICQKPAFTNKKSKKRKRETIVNSGAYDIPKFVPSPLTDREKEKEKLRNILSGIYEILEHEDEACRNTSVETAARFSKHERIEELIREIEERIQFLQEMEKFGVKRKYDFEIKAEITQKLNQLQRFSSDGNENTPAS